MRNVTHYKRRQNSNSEKSHIVLELKINENFQFERKLDYRTTPGIVFYCMQ